jgi:hypothetical protein
MANIFSNHKLQATTSLQPVCSVSGPPGTSALVNTLLFANKTLSDEANVSLILRRSGDPDIYLARFMRVLPGTTLYFPKPITLLPGDSLQVQASANAAIDVVANLVTITP